MSSRRQMSCMNLLANWGPWLDTIFLGMPKKGKTFSLYKSATWGDIKVTEVGIAMTIFEKWSTIFRITSWPFEVGKGPMRSTKITSQGWLGGECECKAGEVGRCEVLFSWHCYGTALQPLILSLWSYQLCLSHLIKQTIYSFLSHHCLALWTIL